MKNTKISSLSFPSEVIAMLKGLKKKEQEQNNTRKNLKQNRLEKLDAYIILNCLKADYKIDILCVCISIIYQNLKT